jgi:type I restriction enzyme S subunit
MHVLFSSFFKQQLFNRSTGSTVKGVRSKELAQISVPLPPIELQNQFAQHIEAIEQQKQQAQASLEKSEALFNSLLQRAFKGELTG